MNRLRRVRGHRRPVRRVRVGAIPIGVRKTPPAVRKRTCGRNYPHGRGEERGRRRADARGEGNTPTGVGKSLFAPEG